MAIARGFVTLALGQLLLLSGCSAETPTTVDLPSSSQIASMRAEVKAELFKDADVAPFEVPPEHYAAILRAFTPAVKAKPEVGSFGAPIAIISIRATNGQTHQLEVPWSGQNPLAFTVDGLLCYRGGEYRQRNVMTKEDTVVFPDESVELYNYLREIAPTSAIDRSR